ncbi:MAG TPA: hypothetical protein PK156_27085 [Polyangium sp.]|nr:hypothetical protein [Polyangium sp.]
MARRRSWGMVVSGLSLLSGCGGAPSPALPHPTALAGHDSPQASQTSQQAASSSTSVPTGACVAQRASTLRPLQSGRGERVVLALRDQSKLALVANEDDASIHTIDLDKHDEIGVTQLPGAPSALVMLSDGRLVATLRDRNEIVVLEAEDQAGSKFQTRCRLSVPSEPVGLSSVSTNGTERVLVTAGYGHALGILDANTFVAERWVNLDRDPRAVVVANGRAYVSHMVSADVSVVELDSGKTQKINVLSNKRMRSLGQTGTGDLIMGNQAFALAMNEKGRLFTPMVTVDPGEPKITGAYGSTESPIKPFVGVIDLVAGKQLELGIPGTSHHQLECMLPRAAAATGDRLFVACLGSNELVEFDARGQNAAEFVRRRVQLPRGPLGMALDEHRAIVLSQFDRAVSIVDVEDPKSAPVLIALSRPEGQVDEVFERGRQIFHDGFETRVSNDGRACANCHPDGREDGFTWSTPDGPRQTISLAGRVPNAAPYGWFGNHFDVHSHLAQTVARLGGQGFDTKDRADLNALVTYISRMKAPVGTQDQAAAELVSKGRDLFHAPAQGCGECHAEGGTDRARHDIGTGRDIEASFSFDTPSLMAIAGSAPYYHDGRYKSLDELLAKADDKMGHAKHLNADERTAMVAYMNSLSPDLPSDVPMRNFVRPANLPMVLPTANNAFEKLALRQNPPRKAMDRIDLDLDALPIVQIDPPVKYDEKNPEPQGGEIEKLLVWNGECAAVPYHSAAHLEIDWQSSGMTRLLERCVYRPYDDGQRVWRDMTAQMIDPLPNGRLHVEEHRGFFRVNTHEFRATSVLAADAMPLGNGLLFAFRTNCAACKEGDREKLQIIAPSTAFWGDEFFHWRIFKLDRGTNDGMEIVINVPNLERWKKVTKTKVEMGGTIGAPHNIVLRLDTTRTFSEDKPSVAVGRTTCIEENFSCG